MGASVRGLARRLRALPAAVAYGALRGERLGGAADRAYAASLRRHRPAVPPLDTSESAIVSALESVGICQTTLVGLGIADGAALVESARRVTAASMDHVGRRLADGLDFVTVPAAAIAGETDLFARGLDERLLDIVENYLGLPPAYDGVAIQYTPADGREVATRRWHRDREDRRMLKVAVYCNDVDADGGPFELIPDRPYDADGDGRDYGDYSDAEISARGLTCRIACEGPAGTVVFADTARHYHRGRPPTRGDRVAIFFSYFARPPRHPFFCQRTGFSRRQIVAMTAHLSPRQRACALWRDTLPAAMRVIPVAPI